MNNYLRKHGEGRAGFTLDPTATAGSSCAAAAGLEHDFTALPNPSVPHPFLPRNPYLIPHAIGVFLPVGAKVLSRAVIAPNPDFRQLVQV